MDLQYLLWLQDIRFSLGSGIEDFFIVICSGYVLGLMTLVAVIIYWTYDKKTGEKLLLTFCVGNFLNGALKILFCCYRPWIRDPGIRPSEAAKASATGYSFPSGHSTLAVSFFGFSGWIAKGKNRWFTILAWIYCGLLLFARNYLGVHTPQDVIVGALLGVFSIWLTSCIFSWVDQYEGGDRVCLLAGLALVAAVILITYLKPYPMDYVNGQLLVDPAVMQKDCFRTSGAMAGVLTGWYLERRYVNFETSRTMKTKILRLVIGCAVLLAAFGVGLLVKRLIPADWIADTFLGAIVFFSGSFLAPLLFFFYEKYREDKVELGGKLGGRM